MSLDAALNKAASLVPECLAAGYVDTESGMLLAIKTVDSHPREVIDLVAAATADLFNGPNVSMIERMFKKSRGVAVVESNFVCNATANLSARSSLSNFSENLPRNQILRELKVNFSAKFLRKANLSAICRLHRGRRDAEDRSKIRVVAEAQSRNGDARLLVE